MQVQMELHHLRLAVEVVAVVAAGVVHRPSSEGAGEEEAEAGEVRHPSSEGVVVVVEAAAVEQQQSPPRDHAQAMPHADAQGLVVSHPRLGLEVDAAAGAQYRLFVRVAEAAAVVQPVDDEEAVGRQSQELLAVVVAEEAQRSRAAQALGVVH